MMDNLQESLVKTMEMVAGEYLTRAGYDRTIQATVLSCVDENTGKYRIKYQDSKFYAYAANIETKYAENSQVYILIPGNDMTMHKTILGAVKNEGLYGNKVLPRSARYLDYGTNLITLKNNFGLCSYKSKNKESYVKVMNPQEEANPKQELWYVLDNEEYILTEDTTVVPGTDYYCRTVEKLNTIEIFSDSEANKASEQEKDLYYETDKIKINLAGIKEYILDNDAIDTLKIGGIFATDLPEEQRLQGNYGLRFVFSGKIADNDVEREYTMTIQDMEGDPYRYFVDSEQTTYLTLGDFTFEKLKSITFYAENFPIIDFDNYHANDIFLKGVTFQGCESLNNEEIKGVYLKLTTPQGSIFYPYQDTTQLSLVAEVYNGGTPVKANSNSLGYYWYDEVADAKDDIGGRGWHSLNSIDASTQKPIPGNNIYTVNRADIPFYSKLYQSVAIYNAQRLTKTVRVLNYSAKYKMELYTPKTVFSNKEQGSAEIELKLYYRDYPSQQWQTITDFTNFTIKWYGEDNYKNYKELPRVENYKVLINDFNQFYKVHCTVQKKNDSEIYGSETLTLVKVAATNEPFTLEIINDNGAFVYNEEGIAPTNLSLSDPITINPLSFKLYDNINQVEIDTSAIPAEKIVWRFPLEEESLLSPNSSKEENGQLIVTGHTAAFTLDDIYSIEQNVNNRVYLDITYGQYPSLRTWIDINCRKEGENGTNGTGYSLTIEPVQEELKGFVPTICFYKEGLYFKPLNDISGNNWFNVNLWLHGTKVFTGSKEGLGIEHDNESVYSITWEFKQHSQSSWKEKSLYKVEGDIFSIRLNDNGYLCDEDSTPFTSENEIKDYLKRCCHILQATVEYKGQTIMANQPIATLIIDSENSNNKTIRLNSGFREVIYKSDGTQSKYKNNNLLTLQYLKNAQIQIIPEDQVDWEPYGQYPVANGSTTDWLDSKDLVLKEANNQEYLSPADTYSGFCYTNAAAANVNIAYGETVESSFIHIPIHFYLNRYANKAINGWDGNAININEEEGIILSPQVGAGKKEKDNSFTGVVIGVSKILKDENQIKKEKTNTGLFGYTHGQQSIFLDSETGSATFGIEKAGQIKISPAINEYGEFNADPNIQSGSYTSNAKDKDGSGLSIGFGINPYIYYGSRKFTVDPNGNVIMQDATIEGCFFARNKNTQDESEILIGTDPTNINKQRSSHIYLYDYYNDEDELKQLSYIKIKPGNFDVTVKDISADDNSPRDEQDKSYLRFNDQKGLQLKGEFRCKTYNTDVVFSNNSSDTQIEFWSYQDDEAIREALNRIEEEETSLYNNYVTDAIAKAEEALKIRYTDLSEQYVEDCPYSIDEIEDFIKTWVKDYDLLNEKQDICKQIVNNVKQLINQQKGENGVDNLKKQIQVLEKKIQNFETEKIIDGEFVDESKLEIINSDIAICKQSINDLILQIRNIQQEKDKLKDNIKQYLKKINYHLISNREYQDFVKTVGTEPDFNTIKNAYDFYNIHTLLGYEDFIPLFRIDDFSFDFAAILNELECILIKINAANSYKTYLTELKQKEQERRVIERQEHPLRTKSLWSPSEFYFNVYNEEGDDVISGISYDSSSKILNYVGGVDFEAPPYARLKMTTDVYKSSNDEAGEKKGENASELYFKTFFLNEKGDLNIQNPKSQIVLKAGYLKVASKTEPNAPESSLTMRNGKLELKNVEFAIKTYASDVAFTNNPSTTHIRFKNYDIKDGEEELQSSVRITPSIFAVQGTESSLHYNPLSGRLNYTGNINVSNSNGLFRLDERDMVLRFGTTIEDYVDTEQAKDDERFSGVPLGSKVTDFRLSSNGFSIRSYGKKENKNIETNNQIEYSNKEVKSVAEQWQDFINSGRDDITGIEKIRKSFSKEIVAEDNVQTDNTEAFEENYWANFIVPESEVNTWNATDLNNQETEISVPIKDFKQVNENSGDYIIDENGNYTYVGEGNGNYVWQNSGTENIEIPQQEIPKFIDAAEYTGIAGTNKTWAETSGLYYNSKTGKFRLNGDFAVRNNHGSIILSDNLMRIMFKTYEKNADGEDDIEKVASRMCISEDSFYFYSFGKVDIPPAQSNIINDNHGGTSQTNFRTVDGITGAITWRDGILRIVGSIYADKGYIGGWSIEGQKLTSNSENAVLDGATGRLYLSNPTASGAGTNGSTPAGQVVSEFGNRRSRITYGQFFIEGKGESASQTEALANWLEKLIVLCTIDENLYASVMKNNKKITNLQTLETSDPEDLLRGNIIVNDTKIREYANDLINNEESSEEDKIKGRNIITALDGEEGYIKARDNAEKKTKNNAEEDESGIVYWGHQAHLISGYGAAQGAMLASEGYRPVDEEHYPSVGSTEWYRPKITPESISDDDTNTVDLIDSNIPEKGSEQKYYDEGTTRVLNNVNFGIGLTYESLLTGSDNEPSLEFQRNSSEKCVASFVRQTSLEGNSIASLSFVKTFNENDGFAYGTEIFPHVIKTKDIFLTDSENLYDEYGSSSLVGILKELHQIPSKITYVDSENFEEIEIPNDVGEILPNDETAYIIEQWEIDSQYYDLGNSPSNTDQKTILPKPLLRKNGTYTLSNVWELSLKPSEENEDEVDVQSITLKFKNGEAPTIEKKVDLSGFVVHLPG